MDGVVGIFMLVGAIVKGIFLETINRDRLLYRYDNSPCEGKEFVLQEDMVLLENKDATMSKQLYHVSRYSLENYKEYREQEDIWIYAKKRYSFLHKEIKMYRKGEKFRIGKYHRIKNQLAFGGQGVGYYLLYSNDNKKVWIANFRFDLQRCRLEDKDTNTTSEDYDTMEAKLKKTFISYKRPPKAFSNSDELYVVSKAYDKQSNLEAVKQKGYLNSDDTKRLIQLIRGEYYMNAFDFCLEHKGIDFDNKELKALMKTLDKKNKHYPDLYNYLKNQMSI